MTDTLLEMLTYRRPGSSDTEIEFIQDFITPLGATSDEFGNRILRIGKSDTLWSSHTDTVHRMEGRQELKVENNVVSLADGSKSNCLGADCTTGVWLMTEMIKAEVPGLYVFHRKEESGGQGSRFIANKTPELLTGIKKAIAFDRYGFNSIITHQWDRCCSDAFADSLALQLPSFELDTGGVFTDTANYTDLVPECTNISVGYQRHHTANEIQNLDFAKFLLELMLRIEPDKLVVEREPGESDYGNWASWGGGNWGLRSNYVVPTATLESLCKDNPATAASLLKLYGVSTSEFEEHLNATSGRYYG